MLFLDFTTLAPVAVYECLVAVCAYHIVSFAFYEAVYEIRRLEVKQSVIDHIVYSRLRILYMYSGMAAEFVYFRACMTCDKAYSWNFSGKFRDPGYRADQCNEKMAEAHTDELF